MAVFVPLADWYISTGDYGAERASECGEEAAFGPTATRPIFDTHA